MNGQTVSTLAVDAADRQLETTIGTSSAMASTDRRGDRRAPAAALDQSSRPPAAPALLALPVARGEHQRAAGAQRARHRAQRGARGRARGRASCRRRTRRRSRRAGGEVLPRAHARGTRRRDARERAGALDHLRADVGGVRVVTRAARARPRAGRSRTRSRARARRAARVDPRRERGDVALRRQQRLGREQLVDVGAVPRTRVRRAASPRGSSLTKYCPGLSGTLRCTMSESRCGGADDLHAQRRERLLVEHARREQRVRQRLRERVDADHPADQRRQHGVRARVLGEQAREELDPVDVAVEVAQAGLDAASPVIWSKSVTRGNFASSR